MPETVIDTTTQTPNALRIYSWWDEVPEHLKTQEQLKQKGLLPTGEVQARVVYGQGRRARSYDLYDQSQTRPISRKEPSAKQQANVEGRRAQQDKLNRTCRCCRQIMDKVTLLNASGLCTGCE